MREFTIANVEDFQIIPPATTACVVLAAVVCKRVESATKVDETDRTLICADHIMAHTPHLAISTLRALLRVRLSLDREHHRAA